MHACVPCRLGIATATAIWFLVAETTALGEVPDAAFVEGLRQRQLWRLAESHCRQRLATTQPGEPAQAELTIELIRTLALVAVNAPAGERVALWPAARKAAADFLAQRPSHPRAVLIRLQDALTPLAAGELGRQEFEAGALPDDQLEATRAALRDASRLLEDLDNELTREIPLKRRATLGAGELSADDLFGLQQHVQHQLSRSLRNQALLYPAGSDDRLALLLAASQSLERALPSLAASDPLAAEIQLDMAACRRLLGKPEDGGRLAAAIDAEEFPPDVRLRARAELIRCALAQDDPALAERLMTSGRTIDGQAHAELDFAWFEALLALADAASADADRLKRYHEQAAKLAEFLEQSHGAYWGRRANQVLAHHLPRGAAGGANVELLSRTADSLYLKGDFDRAIATYDEASSAARQAGALDAAFDLAYKAGLVEQKRSRHQQAATRLRLAARTFATHQRAAEAHLLGAWNAAQRARTDPAAMEDYLIMLREHVATWPMVESAGQAGVWLGKLLASRGELAEATTAYANVSRGSPHYAEAIDALRVLWKRRLAESARPESKREAAAEAVRFFQQAIVGSDDRLPERWTAADRAAALAAAELIAAHLPERLAEAEGMLKAALAGPHDAEGEALADWRAAAEAQSIVSLAGQAGREAEALAALQEPGSTSPTKLLTVLEGLSSVQQQGSDTLRKQIAALQLQAIERLKSSGAVQGGADAQTLERIQAMALAASGRRSEALAAYAALAKREPKNAEVQSGYAALLLQGTEPAELNQALGQWRVVATRSKPRTSRWYEAKYSVALAQFKLGDQAAAAQLLRYLLETPPGLSGTPWEAAYRELLGRCEK